MRYSKLYSKTKRSVAQQDSKNAYLLEKAGYINQVAAGVYAFMPLAVLSLHKIEGIIREEMNAIGGSEVLLSALQPKSIWETSGRWEDEDFRNILYKFTDAENMLLAPTHEEPLSVIVRETVQSYRDLPVLIYQFQTKFRKELRPKSGLLRGREFRMKDLYSFHPDEKSHNEFYEQAAEAYLKTFKRLGLDAYRVKASGGVFSQEFSDEFQVLCPTGEDEIWIGKDKTGYNQEVEAKIPTKIKKSLKKSNAIEVGNIFHLGTKYTDAFDFKYLDASGQRQSIFMGSYGIGISRLLGTLAELYNDEAGLKLPAQIAPFQAVIIDMTESKTGEKLYTQLEKAGIEALLDDRDEPAGAKLVESDLLGIPFRLVYSQKTAQDGKVELKDRSTGKIELIPVENAVEAVRNKIA